MRRLAKSLLDAMDVARSRVFRTTLAWSPLRRVFAQRGPRLLALFLLSSGLHLTASLFFPLWVLVVGPILWGLPHLVASLRFTHNVIADDEGCSLARTRLVQFCGLLWIGVALFRMHRAFGVHELVQNSSAWPEVVSMLITLAGCALIYRKSVGRGLIALGILTPLVTAFWVAPLWTAGTMVLAHNAIAFIYWVRAARSPSDRSVALLCLALFLALNGLIFAGAFDPLLLRFGPVFSLPWAGIDVASLGRFIVPGSEAPLEWFHAVIAFAFGQSLHYFIWLKAIPEVLQAHQAPASFRQSWRLFKTHCGRFFAVGSVMVCVAGLTGWLLLSFETARALYFAVAAYHGYFEIACLSMVAWDTQRGPKQNRDQRTPSQSGEVFQSTGIAR